MKMRKTKELVQSKIQAWSIEDRQWIPSTNGRTESPWGTLHTVAESTQIRAEQLSKCVDDIAHIILEVKGND